VKFMVQWSYPAGKWEAIAQRWNSGHKQPLQAKGAKFLGKWHGIGENKGFMLYEAEDPVVLNEVLLEWRDLLDYQVTLVVADEELPRDYTVPR
jgi:hypothetical protein